VRRGDDRDASSVADLDADVNADVYFGDGEGEREGRFVEAMPVWTILQGTSSILTEIRESTAIVDRATGASMRRQFRPHVGPL
jgi:hypothetical protein